MPSAALPGGFLQPVPAQALRYAATDRGEAGASRGAAPQAAIAGSKTSMAAYLMAAPFGVVGL